MAETGVLADDALRPVVPSIAWYDTRGEEEAERHRGRAAGLRRAHRPAAERDVHAGQVRLDAPPLAGRGARHALAQRRRVDRARPRRRAGPRGLARLAHRLLRPPHGHAPGSRRWRGRTRPRRSPRRTHRRARRLGRAGERRLRRHSREPRRSRLLTGAEGAVLAVGGHDHAAAAVGAGAAGEGDVLDSCGTAEAILRATAPLDPDDGPPRRRRRLHRRPPRRSPAASCSRARLVRRAPAGRRRPPRRRPRRARGRGADGRRRLARRRVPRRARGGRARRRRHPRPDGGARRAARSASSSPAAGPRASPRARSSAATSARSSTSPEGYAGCRGARSEQQLPGVHDPGRVAALLDRAQQLEPELADLVAEVRRVVAADRVVVGDRAAGGDDRARRGVLDRAPLARPDRRPGGRAA